MGIVTTYVCDVSGKQGKIDEFVRVVITCTKVAHTSPFHPVTSTEKFIHVDVARKLNLVMAPKNEDPQPEPTLESKLLVLLKEYVEDIAYTAADTTLSNSRN